VEMAEEDLVILCIRIIEIMILALSSWGRPTHSFAAKPSKRAEQGASVPRPSPGGRDFIIFLGGTSREHVMIRRIG